MEFYEPEKILHRSKQIKKIKEFFNNFEKFGVAENLLCQGVSGSGKTLIINNILKTQEGKYIYVDGAEIKSTFKILRILFDVNYNNLERVLGEGIRKLKENPKVLVIDEIQKIEDLERFFDCLNVIYRKTGSPMILISNKIDLISQMPDDARLTLFFERNTFRSYNAVELKDIINSRLKLIKIKNMEIPEGAVNLICAEGSKEGSARITLNLMRKCILKNKFDYQNILKFKEEIEDENLKFWIDGLNQIEKTFLKKILNLKATNKEITSPEILREMGGIYLPKISLLITNFENYGILKTEYKNLGRGGGRRRTIDFSSNEMFKKLDKLMPI